ncbi:MAG: threonine/serine dehydratase [Gemmatimonadota bacterium]
MGDPSDGAGLAGPAGGTLVGLDAIRRAAEQIRPAARRTPLLDAPPASPGDGSAGIGTHATGEQARLWLKCECLQHAGAFKLRGAYAFVSGLAPEERAAGVITYSSGNHAQAVAWSARAHGVPATVVMPVDAPRVKLEGTLRLGARVERVGTTTLERKARAEEIATVEGSVMVPPFDHPEIIAGQGTTGLEIHEQLGEERERRRGAEPPIGPLGLVLVPIGGGGLISGVAAAVRALAPSARVVGVEPAGAPKMRRSLDAGHPVTLDRIDTVADGLKPVRPGELTFAHVRALVDDVVLVEDDAIRAAVVWCHRRGLVVEPSGAATVAALLSGRVAPAAAAETCAVLSGGNVDPALLRAWLEAAA